MSEKKLKIVWICHFSDSIIRGHLQFDALYYKRWLRLFKKREALEWRDKSIWVSNALREFESFHDIDLTVVFPHLAIKGLLQEFSINGIHYKCFRSEDDHLIPYLKYHLLHKSDIYYHKNRRIVKDIVSRVRPNVVHVIGAENPYYSITALDIPRTIPLVVSLQTLMSTPDFMENYNISSETYNYRSRVESSVIKRSDYIATTLDNYKKSVRDYVKNNACFLHLNLALGQEINLSPVTKEYDFVYFATNVAKAGDYAIEAFALVCRQRPEATLNLSGYCSPDYKIELGNRLKELGINNNVFFTGQQATHNDVLHQIKRARFAVLPLKIDLISSTIREAMACGLPTVTTITPSTPDLNSKRESVLLSEKGDFKAMADNMLKLMEDEVFAAQIRENALLTIQEQYSNKSFMNDWRLAYYKITNNFVEKKALSEVII